MTLIQFGFEGATAGTTATGGNGTTPGGNTGALVLNKAGGIHTFSAAAATHGSCGLEIVTSTNTQYSIARFLANAPNSKMPVSFTFSYLGTGTGNANNIDVAFAKMRQGSSETAVIHYRMSVADKFYVTDSVSAAISATNLQYQLTPGSSYRVETVPDQAASTVTVRLYTAAGTTPLGTWSSTTANLTTSTPVGMELGCVSANSAMTLRFDDLQMNDGGTTEIGPLVAAVPQLVPSVTLNPTSGPVPRSDGTNGTTVTATITTSGGNANPKTYALRIEYSANSNFTDTVTFLDTTNAYQSSNSFTFTPGIGATGSYRVTPYAQQAA